MILWIGNLIFWTSSTLVHPNYSSHRRQVQDNFTKVFAAAAAAARLFDLRLQGVPMDWHVEDFKVLVETRT